MLTLNFWQCDDYGHLTSWTQQCIRHADVLLVFADSRETHAVTGFEERVEAASIRVTKELVLCHAENTRWLKTMQRICSFIFTLLIFRNLNIIL